MASGAVFESYEILVHVLLSLPLRDLLLSQMINKACFDLVQGSPGIRSALFWKANSSPIHSKEKREVNHTLRFRYFNDEHKKVDAPILNPFVIVRSINHSSEMKTNGNDQFVLLSVRTGQISSFTCWPVRPDRPSNIGKADSRDRMLLAHPPISRIEVMPTRGKCCVAASSGLTQGHLHEYEATAWRVNHGRELDEFLAGKFGLSEITPYRDHILAANTWRRLAKNFDEITGHEMLWILSASSKQLEGLLLEGVGGYVDDVDEDSGDAMADDHSKFDCCVSTHPFHHSCAESAGMASETQDMLLGPPAELNNLQSSSHGPVSKTGLQQHSHTHPELRTRRRTV